MSSFTTPLRVEAVSSNLWKVLEDFTYFIGVEGSNEYVTVPAKYITDFASTPRFMWSLIPPWGEYGKAAVVHDWLYSVRSKTVIQSDGTHKQVEISRKEADNIFLEAMGVLGVNAVKRYAMYAAVRAFGFLFTK